jgi:hypothetical protein
MLRACVKIAHPPQASSCDNKKIFAMPQYETQNSMLSKSLEIKKSDFGIIVIFGNRM